MNRRKNEYFPIVSPIYGFMSQIYEDRNRPETDYTSRCLQIPTDIKQSVSIDQELVHVLS